eukprot:1407969-Alexandrium_andersonii.AAC.1
MRAVCVPIPLTAPNEMCAPKSRPLVETRRHDPRPSHLCTRMAARTSLDVEYSIDLRGASALPMDVRYSMATAPLALS